MRFAGLSGCRWALGLLILVQAVGSSCNQPPPVSTVSDAAPGDVARVNGESISVAEFEQFLENEGLNSRDSEDRKMGLNRLIRQKALAQQAHASGFEATQEEAQQIGWEPALPGTADPDYSLQDALDFLATQKLLASRLNAQDEIDLRTLLQHYERNLADYQVDDQFRVLEILVQNRSEAERIRKELRPGDFRQFREMARAYSTGVGAEWGGELGVFQRGDFPPRFEDVVFKLRVGEISEIFPSELGLHIFTIEELIPRHAQKFYEVQDQIFEELVAERERDALDLLVNQILQSTSIEIIDPQLSRDWRKSDAQLP